LIDREIIEECRKGNLRNFRELVGKTSPFAFSVAFRMLGDEDLAEDVVQDTMVTVWQKIGKINSPDGFKKWLYKIVVNKCYDVLRKKKKAQEYQMDESAWAVISNHLSEESSSEMENKETAAVINLLTNNLSPKQKAVFVLCDLEEMTLEEISGITGMNKANVKANLYYARKRINEMIKIYGQR
jgi:RNA polymerase sigma-70 factor (ECF subfamily)